MEASVNVGGIMSESIKVENGVKQQDLVVQTLFSIFITVVTVTRVYIYNIAVQANF